MVVTALQSMALVTFGLHAALFWDEVAFSPPSWAVLSVCCWSGFVLAKVKTLPIHAYSPSVAGTYFLAL